MVLISLGQLGTDLLLLYSKPLSHLKQPTTFYYTRNATSSSLTTPTHRTLIAQPAHWWRDETSVHSSVIGCLEPIKAQVVVEGCLHPSPDKSSNENTLNNHTTYGQVKISPKLLVIFIWLA